MFGVLRSDARHLPYLPYTLRDPEGARWLAFGPPSRLSRVILLYLQKYRSERRAFFLSQRIPPVTIASNPSQTAKQELSLRDFSPHYSQPLQLLSPLPIIVSVPCGLFLRRKEVISNDQDVLSQIFAAHAGMMPITRPSYHGQIGTDSRLTAPLFRLFCALPLPPAARLMLQQGVSEALNRLKCFFRVNARLMMSRV